ncbi:methyl-accepting chemotaxis protein [Oceanospirillum sediminis]|uniref:Methyl-accepting chemotaxis protein n=1 Tax=Oceanospirillum sediminis TaxID=2760088 RepID=A0A839IV05_9GAMM|nr:methyl-accepting chemotaxis protein [Oceanospirillum sediminis]MBB1488788.1 hypothetical protein [Oceanospirillum sediminis]
MSLNLSLRQKLIAIVLVVILGFGAMGLYTIQSLNGLTEASEHVSRLGEASQSVGNLQVRLLQFEKQRDSASPETITAIEQTLKALQSDGIAQLTAVEQAIDDQRASALIRENKAVLGPYLNQLGQWIETRKALGLSPDSGNLGQIEKDAAELLSEIEVFGSFAARLREVRAKEKDFLIYPNDEQKAEVIKTLEQLRTDIRAMAFDDIFFPFVDKYEATLNSVIQLRQQLAGLDQNLASARQQVSGNMQSATDYLQNNLLKSAQQHAAEESASTRWSVLIGSLVLASVIGLIVTSVAMSIARNMKQALAALNEVAHGNLTSSCRENGNQQDEFNQLARATNTMTSGLHDVVGHLVQSNQDLKQTADSMDGSVQQIVQGSQMISDRSSSLVAATEQISATADQVAETTQHVSESAQNAFDTAHRGAQVISEAIQALADVAEVVEETSHSVEALGARSKEIDVVIDLIVGVAEQTNLLALNAAIEAARAGEAGRGFAVVADEVRTLAEQTVKATSDITAKVEAIQQDTHKVIESMQRSKQRVDQGRALGDQAVSAVQDIERQTREAADQTEEIMNAVREVAMTTRQMAQDMDQISSEIDQNHQATAQIVAASRAVHERAEQLEGLTTRFRI